MTIKTAGTGPQANLEAHDRPTIAVWVGRQPAIVSSAAGEYMVHNFMLSSTEANCGRKYKPRWGYKNTYRNVFTFTKYVESGISYYFIPLFVNKVHIVDVNPRRIHLHCQLREAVRYKNLLGFCVL